MAEETQPRCPTPAEGGDRGSPPNPGGSPRHTDAPQGPPRVLGTPVDAPPNPGGPPQPLEGSPQAVVEPGGGCQGDPPTGLGVLRAALEAALIRDPGEATPAELSPILGVPLPPPAKCRHLDGARLLRDNLRLVF